MRFVRRALLVVAAGLALSVGSPAQEKGGEIAGGFRAFVIAEPRYPESDIRNRTGKMPDLVTEHGLNPVIAVFARTVPAEAANPLIPVVRKIDELVEKYKSRKLGAYLVFLALPDEYRKADKDNTRDAKVTAVKQWVNGAKPTKTTIGLAEATIKTESDTLVPKQVTDMGITAEDDLVILFYYQYRVVKRLAYKVGTAPSEADLKDLSDAVEKVLGGKR
jgi:hypothetical protein